MKSPRDFASRMRARADDGYKRETFILPLAIARAKASEIFERYPKAGKLNCCTIKSMRCVKK